MSQKPTNGEVMLTRILATIALILSSACATIKPIHLDVPPPSLEMEEPNGQAEIVVVRRGIMAWANTFGVYVNDMHVGELHTDDYVHTYVEPGTVEMFAGAENRSEARFPVEADRVYYFQAHPEMGAWTARVRLEIVEDPATGPELIEGCVDKTFDEPEPYPFDLEQQPAETEEDDD